jgi:hypothetical protein
MAEVAWYSKLSGEPDGAAQTRQRSLGSLKNICCGRAHTVPRNFALFFARD